jgi:type III pantothenate kinase
LPLPIDVDQPARVGMDRLLASLAAERLREPEQGAVIVSIGSAITVNLLTAEGHFAGGAILPGLFMAAQALSSKTDALPLVSRSLAEEPPPACGRNTKAAIASGLYWGAVGAVRELVGQLGQGTIGSSNLFFTGGDGQRFAEAVDRQAVYRGDLVLLGVALVGRTL